MVTFQIQVYLKKELQPIKANDSEGTTTKTITNIKHLHPYFWNEQLYPHSDAILSLAVNCVVVSLWLTYYANLILFF